MELKNFNLSISAVVFLLGAFFVLSDNASITANAIGYGGSNYAVSSIMGLIMIVAGGAFFLLTINLGDLVSERLVRTDHNKHEEIKSQMQKKDDEERYEHNSPQHKE